MFSPRKMYGSTRSSRARFATARRYKRPQQKRNRAENHGGCQAIEDGAALAEALRASSDDGRAVAAYESRRRKQATTFARRSRRLPRVAHLRARSGCG
jgi:hypothetical protein